MKLINITKIVGVSAIVLLMSGCATTQQVPLANEKNLRQGNALIKVERESGFMGGGRSVEITDNGKVVGDLSQGKSLVWQRKAGSMSLNISPSFGMVKEFPPINENVKAGKTYAYKTYMNMSRASFVIEEK